MEYRVLALKYRPGGFEEIVGQQAVTSVLAGAVDQGRLAQAYLFSGPRGCGKTTTARILAKALNCERGPTSQPCGECASCKAVAAGNSLAVIEIDAASSGGVDDIRGVRAEAALGSMGGRYKVYILDEAHQISAHGANALLKTLEEPPPNTVFVLATTEPHKILPTIHSRCQRFAFRLLGADEIAGRLGTICERENVAVPAESLQAIARRADGSMRDGITLLDQALAASDGALDLDAVTGILGLTRHDHYFALDEAWQAEDAAAALRALDTVLGTGLGAREFALGLVRHFRDLLFLRLDPGLLAGEMGADDHARCAELAAGWQVEDLLHLTRLVGERADQIRYASQPRVLLETLVVEIARFERRVVLAELLGRLRALDGASAGSGGAGPSAQGDDDPPARSRPGPSARAASAAPRPAPAPRVEDAPSPRPQPGATASPDAAAARQDAPAAMAGDDPAELWGEFVRQVGRSMKSLGSFLERARPGGPSGKHYRIVVENPFHLAMLDTPEHLRLMGDTLAGLTGQARAIRLELAAGSATAAAPGPRISAERAAEARREQALSDHADSPLIQDLLQRFDGEVLED
ncbi:MAG: DNA polymerase III subunit gamma/tau [Candidatus Latescibacteria bacterium]|nr:DNA polymerase III subunit gamma/tau [Candidatus Latescibacterota bacterium]